MMTMVLLVGSVAVTTVGVVWSAMLIFGRRKQDKDTREAAVRVPDESTMALDARARWSGL